MTASAAQVGAHSGAAIIGGDLTTTAPAHTPGVASGGATAAPVQIVLDATMMREPLLNFHPLANTATTTIASADLLAFLRAQGHAPLVVDFGPDTGPGAPAPEAVRRGRGVG